MSGEYGVLIVEDRQEIQTRLARSVELTKGLEVCGTAGDVDFALKELFEKRPRIVLIDLGLPDGSGIEVIEAINGVSWPCDAMVISIFGDEARVIEALKAGATGYILKGGPLDAIGEDIHSILNGGSPISPQIARHLLSMVKSAPSASAHQTLQIELTKRETEILNAVAKGYRRREIADKMGITEGTVGNHIHNIYQKLNVNSNTEAIAHATRIGLI